MLKVKQLTGGYGGSSIVNDISFEVEKGEMFGVLGPNGSGKTTLLKMISGILPYTDGEVVVHGSPLSSYSQKQLAKVIAVLPQHSVQAFSYSVKETVSLGRYSHQSGWFRTWSVDDEEIVHNVMDQTGITDFQDKDIQQLSGGERQRVFLAQALAQEPEILLLDEPTNHLDLSFQKELLDLLKQWTRERGLTVVSIFHDLNLAGLYCDRLLLLEKGVINVQNTPSEVLRKERIQAVYNTEIDKQPHPKVPAPQMVLLPDQMNDERSPKRIDQSLLDLSDERIVLHTPEPLRTMSSGVIGAGTGWNHTFVNRHVGLDYNCEDHRNEMADYLNKNGFEPADTVGMMTAVILEDVSYRFVESDGFSTFVVVTAGVGNAIDASKSEFHTYNMQPGTINTWIFVNGEMTEEAFIQAMITATETKVKVLHDQHVIDPASGTLATGTSTDSILIAATQKGKKLEFAGTITPLGKLISKAVYDCTTVAIQNYQARKRK
ncbi:adenosylcobinamide amidohydrolase [Alkalihalobacillus sp. AL-G]|uniref:adenosylcobinamide amidohydrolase n=1 Tax=Alkalihalobacillus sp. AL-G TaxID=2926399 RepID=UPI0027296A1D|nr:adenosylcobinamide amidohydrolase [Alkalihalobacillus sp. AL-G]WLD91661.1 adenosylcobinamide amidohydrolase [Alkalihalobacillus sp. AL-G]